MTAAQTDLGRVARLFETYAARDYHGASPLYEKLSLAIAKDDELLGIAVFFVSARERLTLERFAPDFRDKWVLGNYEQHGPWLEWLDARVESS